MLKRYELTDQEWEQIVPLIPYNKGKRGVHQRRTVWCSMPWSGLHAAVLKWIDTESSTISSGFWTQNPNYMSFQLMLL